MMQLKDVKSFIKKYILLICIFLISFIKIHITNKLPILAIPDQVYDDGLMVLLAKNLIQGNWLGAFESSTLVKGAGFPIFLALLKSFNLSYLFTINILYTLSCIYFIYSIKDDIKNTFIRILIFIIMLFNPISYATHTFQRVYRNGIIIFQTIFIFSAIYIIWKNRFSSIKKLLPHVLIASINMVFLYHSREDSIWIMPFLLVSFILILINIIFKHPDINNIKTKIKKALYIVTKSLIILMPIWVLVFSTTAIKIINYRHYGMFIERESETYLSKVVTAFYSVKAYDDIPRVDNTREKINRIYEISETLESIKPNLENSLDVWSAYGAYKDKKEVENGWFGWALKYAALISGKYFSQMEADEFFQQVYNEINIALENGKLEKEPNVISNLLPPFRDSYKDVLLNYCLGYVQYIYEFRDVQCTNLESKDFIGLQNANLSDFEFITNNKTSSRNITNARLCGWYSLNNKEDFKLLLTNEDGNNIAEIPRGDSSDVINVFSLNPDLKYRFDFVITDIESISDYNELFISVYDMNNNLIENIPLDSYEQYAIIENDISTYSLSIISIEKNIDPVKSFSEKSVNTLNAISSLYAKTGKSLLIISLFAYIIILITTIIKSIKNKNVAKEFDVFLVLSAYLLSAIVVIVGVAYTGLTSCYTLLYSYLSSAYPLFMMFATLGIFYIIDIIINKFICKKV